MTFADSTVARVTDSADAREAELLVDAGREAVTVVERRVSTLVHICTMIHVSPGAKKAAACAWDDERTNRNVALCDLTRCEKQ